MRNIKRELLLILTYNKGTLIKSKANIILFISINISNKLKLN
jgi:hypothetical protein